MLEIRIGEYSATVSVFKSGFDVKETAAMISHTYLGAVLSMVEKERNKQVAIKVINGLMDGVDRALREAEPSCAACMDERTRCGAGFERIFFGKRGDTNA